jgi:thiol-disulfide isomerase/thioredoxin
MFKGMLSEVNRLTISDVYFDWKKGQYQLSMDDLAPVFVGGGTIHVISTGNMSRTTVTGSPAEQDFREADKRTALLMDTLRQIVQMGQQTQNMLLAQKAMGRVEQCANLAWDDYTAFIRQHPSSGVNLYLVQQLMGYNNTGRIDSVAALYQGLPAATRSSRRGQAIGYRLNTELKTAVGHKAIDFTQNDPEGHPVSLSSFKGKYVLLDFWASWDNNAARALPILAKAGELYNNKGLVILGVSLDADKESWLQMIHETNSDVIKQVSDLKGRSNAAALMYGITALPRNVLIDPNGVIIARNLTSLTLDKTLSSIFE